MVVEGEDGGDGRWRRGGCGGLDLAGRRQIWALAGEARRVGNCYGGDAGLMWWGLTSGGGGSRGEADLTGEWFDGAWTVVGGSVSNVRSGPDLVERQRWRGV